MNTTIPKGCDFENHLRRMAKDEFKRIKNPNVANRNLKTFSYLIEDAVARQRVRDQAPRAILPQDLVVERSILEPIRIYEVAQLRCLVNEDIFAIESMSISYKPKHESEAKYYIMIIKKLANVRRGLLEDDDE
ncbi:hypothetical protein L1987_00751 [Smallanthus sonchifolius]|uniref:Uncharacterized protein n=1 Tax=Smallanthus sonchifolius TaxID=185202 RepID=A0ACB9K3D8_9ASTR|nr:hypothetical protein L1987_00751 [Smallanthus sonchifolius]